MSSQIDRRTGLKGNAAIKLPVKAATTANITLSGEQTIDGVSCVSGDRVLVKDQTDKTTNGVYVVDTGTWNRAPDFDGANDVVKGTFLLVTDGTTNGETYWRVTTDSPIVPDTSEIEFEQTVNELAGVSAFIQTLLDDTTAAEARATLGAASQADLDTAEADITALDGRVTQNEADIAAAAGVLDRDVTVTEVVNSTTETTVYSFSVPANTLSTDRMLRVTLMGDLLINTGSPESFTFRVKLGSTTVGTMVMSGSSSALIRRSYTQSRISAFNASNAQVSSCDTYLYVGEDGTDSGNPSIRSSGHNSIAEDSTTALTLAITVELGTASVNLRFRTKSVHLELL